ncbi:hypothetical protein FACS18948_6520 [Clostridia bacterium]|nr:hypothetical protein FACS18948_6520 [Clostridia bacterium]
MIRRDRVAAIDAAYIKDAVSEFRSGKLPKLMRLKEYYDGRHSISGRVKQPGMSNARIAHDIPRYITAMASGYMLGKPVKYTSDDEPDAVKKLIDAYESCDAASVDSELAMAASVYGLGVCVVFADEDGEPHCASIDPMAAFVIYDDTVEAKPICGIYWNAEISDKPREKPIKLTVCDAEYMWEYAGANIESLAPIGEPYAHAFGYVPVIEFWNDADERGDWEGQISEIDAYDQLQSDRVNDKAQFTDSFIVFTGVGGADELDEQDRSVADRLRRDKMLMLPDKDAKVEWLTKSLNEMDAQVLADSLREDIFKLAMVPDLTDKNFAGNSSGVAIQYKLIAFENKTNSKERWFREGLRWRLRAFAWFLGIKYMIRLNPDRVKIQFNRNLPINEYETAQTVNQLRGLVPDQLLLERLPFIDDSQKAMELLEQEAKIKAETQALAYGKYDGQ